MHSNPPLIRPIVEPIQEFIHAEAAGGILLLGATWRQAALPLAAALGGSILPALLYNGTKHGSGWRQGLGYPDGYGHCLFAGHPLAVGRACGTRSCIRS